MQTRVVPPVQRGSNSKVVNVGVLGIHYASGGDGVGWKELQVPKQARDGEDVGRSCLSGMGGGGGVAMMWRGWCGMRCGWDGAGMRRDAAVEEKWCKRTGCGSAYNFDGEQRARSGANGEVRRGTQ